MAKDLNDRTLVERVDPLIGAVFDRRYRIDERLAAGGFGAIYRAEHLASHQQVALKVLLPSLTHDPGVVARFRREGATLTALRSPNTITAYELGEAPDGTLYIVMELLRGVTLFERFRAKGRIPWRQMVAIARALCNSLEEAHGLGIIHRDLKPTNIHLEPGPDGDEIVKVLDFGIAKILSDSDFDSTDLTNAGQMIGTLDYMSPEQMVGGLCTGQSDIYTLGIVMYEMVAGRRPFDEVESAAATLAQMLTSSPMPLAQRIQVPPAFDALVMRCLERDPKRRYPDVRAVGTELDKIAELDSEVTRTVPVEINSDELTVVGSGRARGGVREPAPTHLPTDALALLPVPTPMRPQPPPDIVVTPKPIRVTPPPGRARPPTNPPPFVGQAHPRPATTPPPMQPPMPPPIPPPIPPPGGIAGAPYGTPPQSPQANVFPHPYAPSPSPHGPPHAMYPSVPSAYPPPPPHGMFPQQRPSVKQFDMASMAAREATIRQIVWIAVLLLGTIVGVVLATQL